MSKHYHAASNVGGSLRSLGTFTDRQSAEAAVQAAAQPFAHSQGWLDQGTVAYGAITVRDFEHPALSQRVAITAWLCTAEARHCQQSGFSA